ncbi:MAG: bifunctional DNA primase/polymerase [Microthrixaceae bacterium]|nr:bifunctional DNA primase/polymerase [Microthrixaceae bacterium]
MTTPIITDAEMIAIAESIDITTPPWSTAAGDRFRIASAHAYASGFKVLPLWPGLKRPADGHSVYTASGSEVQHYLWRDAASKNEWGIGYVPRGERTPGGSVRMVLDADTRAGYEFLVDLLGAPTVITAGRDKGAHAGGAHWYITVPELIPGLVKGSANEYGIDIIGATGKEDSYVVAPGTWIAETNSYYHLVTHPDRHRLRDDDDPYRFMGYGISVTKTDPAWFWLNDMAAKTRAAFAKPIRPEGYVPRDATALHDWQRDVPWRVILGEDGWRFYRPAPCPGGGCEEWTHPWGASTPKSATAHEEHCPESGSGFPGGALHCWSENARNQCGGYQSVSKITYLAHVRYGGDFRAARAGEGIPDEEDWGLKGCSWEPPTFLPTTDDNSQED